MSTQDGYCNECTLFYFSKEMNVSAVEVDIRYTVRLVTATATATVEENQTDGVGVITGTLSTG